MNKKQGSTDVYKHETG